MSNQQKATGTLADFLTVDGIEIDELIRLTGKDASSISLEILDLEMSGLVERRAGNKIALIEQD